MYDSKILWKLRSNLCFSIYFSSFFGCSCGWEYPIWLNSLWTMLTWITYSSSSVHMGLNIIGSFLLWWRSREWDEGLIWSPIYTMGWPPLYPCQVPKLNMPIRFAPHLVPSNTTRLHSFLDAHQHLEFLSYLCFKCLFADRRFQRESNCKTFHIYFREAAPDL